MNRVLLFLDRKYLIIGVFCLLLPDFIQAQVTIGSLAEPARGALLDLNPQSLAKRGGLLLPNVFITNCDSLPVDMMGNFTPAERDVNAALRGLIVYNDNAATVGGTGEGIYIWDGNVWRRAGANSGFTSSCPTTTVSAAGEEFTCHITDPDCELESDYLFNLLKGADYCTLDIEMAMDGRFKLTFSPNTTAEQRTVILMVTSPCGRSQSFVYSQEGDFSSCSAAASDVEIKAGNGFSLCTDGAVYLYIDGHPSGTYVWTRNGVKIATGTEYIATQAGTYIAYANNIGCTNYKPDTVTVTASATAAPQPVTSIVAQNNGYLCNADGDVQLYATASSGTIHWYKDGLRQSETGSPITAEKGDWFAVVEDGTCSSKASNTISVQLDPNAGSGSASLPMFKINGTDVDIAFTICSGGTLNLSVSSPVAGETYTWYKNETQIGTGTEISYGLGSTTGTFLLRCRATAAGSCSNEKITQVTVSSTAAPATPSILVNTPGDALCGGTATLSANISADSYNWYRSDTETGTYTKIAGESAQTLVITQTGYYKVEAVSGSCVSVRSLAKNISVTSGAATVTISGKNSGVHPGDVESYTATMNNAQGASYSWTVTPGTTGATPTSGTGNQISVTFASTGTATIALAASNACGTATVSNNNYEVEVVPDCNPASITAHKPSSKSVSATAGSSASISVTTAGSPTLTCQWYSNTTAANTDGSAVSGATAATYNTPESLTAGTYYYYCVVTSSCDNSKDTSDVFTVTIVNPATLATGTGTFAGRTCFDVAKTNDGGDCGDLASRQAETLTANGGRADFTNDITNTQTYTFTPSATVSNVRFTYVEASGSAGKIIQSITPQADYSGTNISTAASVVIVYKSGLNADADGKTDADALTVDIYAIYNDDADGTDKAVKLTAKIKDCVCCPGLLISGGEYSDIAMTSTLPSGSTIDNTDGSAGEALRTSGLFAATGKNLCFYYRDYSSTANTNGSSVITWNNATNSGADMSYVCGASDGKGVDAVNAASAWRLPVLFELAQIGQLVSNNTDGASGGTLTQAMVNTAMSYTNGKLPGGSTATAFTMYNLRLSYYWSSTQNSSSDAWTWFFHTSYRRADNYYKTDNCYVRCVRSY
jgi:hypothetical protein